MAKYVAQGRGVTLVTCTLGEEGEVLVSGLAHLAADQEDALGPHRLQELTDAMSELGVADFRFLGGPGTFRDSGMVWHEDGHAVAAADVREDTFWRADLLEAATHLVEVIREVRPQVLVTYDEFGGYGHPDHIQAHRVAMYAASLAGIRSFKPDLGEAWDISKIYWCAMSADAIREGVRALRAAGDTTTFQDLDPDGPMWPMFLEDELIDARIDGTDFVEAKMSAMKAYVTQIEVDGPFFALSNAVGNQAWGYEYYRLARGAKGPLGASGFEEDLFAGLS